MDIITNIITNSYTNVLIDGSTYILSRIELVWILTAVSIVSFFVGLWIAKASE